MEPTTRHSLVLRLRDSADHQAWEEFVEIYEPLVLRLARRRGLQDADARDVCQEVFRAVGDAIERFDPDPAKGSFRGWLFRIARNITVDALTLQGRRPAGTGRSSVQYLLEAQPAPAEPSETEFAMEFKRRAFVWAARRIQPEFTAPTWQAFWRTAVEHQTVASAARELGLSEGAVYIARSRVLARLRACVRTLAEDSGICLMDGDPE
jgi:RNA polymerase sigma-70 factor (ECF subfamily)